LFSSRGWVRFALLLNLLGTILLTLSFQATSSNIRIISGPDGKSLICIGEAAISDIGHGLGIGIPCPNSPTARPIAIVTVEKPTLLYLGFFIFAIGFLIQLIGTASPKSIEQMRAELKEALQQEKLRRRMERLSNQSPK